MKQLKRDLQAVLKSLKQATEKIENLMKKVEKLDKPQASKKPRAKALPKAKAPKKASDSDTVLAIIARSKKGVDGATLRKKTGFEGRKIRDIVYRLKKRGKIKVEGKGVYLKA
ncbi:MAG: hypothetical protein ISS59_04990 [Desulfobacteraceae bacterium]|nr:hypothetical protein [Desulfobacteraceae bacterium]